MQKSIRDIFIQDFNMCFFVSLMLLSLYPNTSHILTEQTQDWFLYLIIPSFNGIFTALIVVALNRYFALKNYIRRYYTPDIGKLTLVAFIAGFCSLYVTLTDFGTYVISAFIIYIAVLNIRIFIDKISSLLRPNVMATPSDLGEFANFFINLIITFTVINLCANTVHNTLNIGPAFNFGTGITAIIDAVYFSIITMTTVGYGQIVPHTAIARIIVSVECLTSYLMLGIMIGIITRGINFNQDEK